MTCRAALVSLILISVSAFAQQPGAPDPASAPDAAPPDVAGPGVARISFVGGDVSVKRGDSGQAVAAAMNAPLLVADTIATGPEARAEVQFDSGHRLRLGNEVDARVAELQNGKFRIELAHGTVSLSVLRDVRAQAEISTPSVSFRPLQRGLYRITVGDDGQTTITVRAGQGEIYSLKGTERLNANQSMIVRGAPDDPEFQIVAAIQRDEWDSWNEQRDQMLLRSQSYQYMNPDIPGAEELDGQGTWVNDPAYGEVWAPHVDPGWAPYSQGRWAWEDYYGWTWVSADPWGWAPYHYGNWYYGSVGWCWYPGPLYRPVFWRPALVAFFGFGGGFGFGGFGSIGWLPLAPFEAFHPWYGRGFSGGFDRNYLAVNNYHFNTVNIANIYRNARVNGAISGVAASSFANGRFSNIARVNTEQVRNAGLVRGPLPIAPTANSLRFSNRATSVNPRSFSGSRFTSPARASVANPVPFEQQRQAIQQSAQRFSQTSAGAGRSFATTQGSVNPNSSWGRFGSPGGQSPSASYARPAVSGSAASAGWARFGSPNASGYARPVASSSAYADRGYYGSAGQSPALRLSPSIVHNRSYDQPSAYRQQQPAARTYSAPRAPVSAPRSSGGSASHASGGGGSHHR